MQLLLKYCLKMIYHLTFSFHQILIIWIIKRNKEEKKKNENTEENKEKNKKDNNNSDKGNIKKEEKGRVVRSYQFIIFCKQPINESNIFHFYSISKLHLNNILNFECFEYLTFRLGLSDSNLNNINWYLIPHLVDFFL